MSYSVAEGARTSIRWRKLQEHTEIQFHNCKEDICSHRGQSRITHSRSLQPVSSVGQEAKSRPCPSFLILILTLNLLMSPLGGICWLAATCLLISNLNSHVSTRSAQVAFPKKQTTLKYQKSKQLFFFFNTADWVAAELVSTICVAWKPNKVSGNEPKWLALAQISLTSL